MRLGVAVTLLGAVGAYLDVVLSPEMRAAELVIIGSLINWLRTVTDKPIEEL